MNRILRSHVLRPVLGALGALALLPASAAGHVGTGPAHGLLHGLAHPLLGWDHLLAMLAVGIWAAQRDRRRPWVLPAVFVGVMVVGGLLGTAGFRLPAVEEGILASVLVLGALIALAARLPLGASAAVVGGFALFHGHAHGAEMPAAVPGFFYGMGFAGATVLLHAAGIGLALASERIVLRGARMEWVRAAGVAICLAGLASWMI